MAWARDDLVRVSQRMIAEGIQHVSAGSPGRIREFLDRNESLVPSRAIAVKSDPFLFSAIRIIATRPDGADLSFSVNRDTAVVVDYGLNIPDYDHTVDGGTVPAQTDAVVTVANLEAGHRYVARLRATVDGVEYRGGDFWIFTPEKLHTTKAFTGPAAQ